VKIKTDKHDTKWSKLVRERDGKCRKCGKQPPYQLQAHHIRPRGRSMTRYDLSNGLTLCVHCHTFGKDAVHTSTNQEAWLVAVIGQAEFDRLEALSLQYKSREKARKEFIATYET
jgi:hypothetical protein